MIWKVVPSILNLEASDSGLIRNIKTGTIYKTSLDKNGYERFHTSINGIDRNLFVHILVCEAFHCMSDLTVEHKDKNKTNNIPNNLEWMNRFKNNSIGHTGMKHSEETKELFSKQRTGQLHPRATLTDIQVKVIKRMLLFNISHRSIAKQFDVTLGVIKSISSGKNWSHITI